MRAENALPLKAEQPARIPVVNSIRITGNKALTSKEIREIMSTSTRDSFLGTGLFSGAPQPFVKDEFVKDISLIRKLYAFNGYLFARIDTTIVRNRKGDVRIHLHIRENKPTRIDSVSFSGLESMSEPLRDRYLEKCRIRKGQIFSVTNLIEERERSLAFFMENGYTLFHPDSIEIAVDTLAQNAGIHFRLSLPEPQTYGMTRVIVHDPLKKNPPETTGLFRRDNVTVTVYGRQRYSQQLFPSSIAWKEGELTRQSLEQRTLENFGATNLFSSISIEKDSARSGTAIGMTIKLEPAPKHQIEPKLLVDNRYGALFAGAALAYENKNLFGAGQQLKISTNYGTETTPNSNYLTNLSSDQYDRVTPQEFNATASLIVPKLGKQGSFYSSSIEYSQTMLPVLLKSQKEIYRGSYSSRPSKNSRLNFDFFELEVVRKDSLRGFEKLFRTDIADNIDIDPTDPVAVSNGIDSLLQTRLNQTFRLRYNYSNRRNIAYQKATIWTISAMAEESGSLLWLIDNYFNTKGYMGFRKSDPQIFGTTYNQYLKFDTQVAMTRYLSSDRQIAARIDLGWMTPYGKAETTPEDHRFFVGGTNSMRGWVFGTLGPGNNSSTATSSFGADIKAELGLEYRKQFFKLFGQPSGIALFTDIGNIWDKNGPYAFSFKSLTRDFAWDWGAGLRIGSPIGPFRFDFAWKLHDPANEQSWRFSKTKLSDLTFNFGIGEPF